MPVGERVIFRSGLKENLPGEAEPNELLFTTDTGEIYRGQGEGEPLKKIGAGRAEFINLDSEEFEEAENVKAALEKLQEQVSEGTGEAGITQISKTNKQQGETSEMEVSGGTQKVVDVYEIDTFAEGEVTIHRQFDNTDNEDFDYNADYVEFGDESTSLITDYETEQVTHDREEGEEGNVYNITVDLTKYKHIEAVELQI